MVYTITLAPLLAVGLPLLLAGAVAAVRPWSNRRPWLRRAVAAGAITWFLVMLQGPALLFAKPITRGTGSVDGLPGLLGVWEGEVRCSRTAETGLTVEAAIAGSVLSREELAKSLNSDAAAMADLDGTAYQVSATVKGDQADLVVSEMGFGTPLTGATVDIAPEGVGGTIVSEPGAILHTDDPGSVVTMTWDCGSAP
jgi:hypothetical protein